MICPNCGKDTLQGNSLLDKVHCYTCKKIFELTEVNVWYKTTILEGEDAEYTGV